MFLLQKGVFMKKITLSLTILVVYCSQSLPWFGYIPDNAKLGNLFGFGAHNAYSIDSLGYKIMPNHTNISINELIKKTIMYELDTYLGTPEAGAEAAWLDLTGKRKGNIMLCHEPADQKGNCPITRILKGFGKPNTFRFFLEHIVQFLNNNPQEIRMISLENYVLPEYASVANGWNKKTLQDMISFFDSEIESAGAAPLVYKGTFDKNITAGDLRRKNKRLIILGGSQESEYVIKSNLFIGTDYESFKNNDFQNNKCISRLGVEELEKLAKTSGAISIAFFPGLPLDADLKGKPILAQITQLFGDISKYPFYNFATEVNTKENFEMIFSACNGKIESKWGGNPVKHNLPVGLIMLDHIGNSNVDLSRYAHNKNKELLKKLGLQPTMSYEAYIKSLR